MEKRIFTIILVVIIGVLVGVGIVSKQARDPLLKELIKQQTVIIRIQQRIERKIASKEVAAQASHEDNRLDQTLQKQQALEERIAALESQIKGMQTDLQQVKAAPSQVRQGPPPEDFAKVHEIPIAHTPVIGNKKAPVTIVEFIDFQCPYCARFHLPVVEAAKAYPGKVNYMIKNFPLAFHSQAKPAAKAAFAAGEQGKYEEMVDLLLKNGRKLNEETFERLAEDLGLNVDKFLKDYKNKDAKWEDYIKKDMALGTEVGVRGTPTFYINGRKTAARDVASWKREIDQILQKK